MLRGKTQNLAVTLVLSIKACVPVEGSSLKVTKASGCTLWLEEIALVNITFTIVTTWKK